VTDPAETQSPPARDLHLWQRSSGRESGASPFGVCVRPSASNTEHAAAPFPHWQYGPAYTSTPIAIGTNSARIDEPLLFALPRLPLRHEPRRHANGVSALRAVCLSAPAASLASDEIRALAGVTGLIFEPATAHLLEISFEGGGEHALDCRPALPLILRW